MASSGVLDESDIEKGDTRSQHRSHLLGSGGIDGDLVLGEHLIIFFCG
jgi:hypothetical protein